MHVFKIVAAAATLIIGTDAADTKNTKCLDDSTANQRSENFRKLFPAYTDELTDATFTKGFNDHSDSVITLVNRGCTEGPFTLGTGPYWDRDDFKAGQGTQPPIPFRILNTWHNCDTLILRWRSHVNVTAPQPMTGIAVLEVEEAPADNRYPFLVHTVYSKFNTVPWLVDDGLFQPTGCNATSNSTRT